jgi:hypothetical protein
MCQPSISIPERFPPERFLFAVAEGLGFSAETKNPPSGPSVVGAYHCQLQTLPA